MEEARARQTPAPDAGAWAHDRAELLALRVKRPWASIAPLMLDWTVIGVLLFMSSRIDDLLGLWMIAAGIGLQLHRIALMAHEFAHLLVLNGRKANDIVGNLTCFFPLGASLGGYRSWHVDHHRHLGTLEDSEMRVKAGRFYRRPLSKPLLLGLFVGDLLGLGLWEILRLQFVLRPIRRSELAMLAGFWGLVIGLGLTRPAVGRAAILYLVGLTTSFWAVYRFRSITEHVGIRDTHRFAAPAWARLFLFPYNTDHHFEHHDLASIPWYNLPLVRTMRGAPEVSNLALLVSKLAEPDVGASGPARHEVWSSQGLR